LTDTVDCCVNCVVSVADKNFTSVQPGSKSGLMLILQVNQSDYLYAASAAAGYRVNNYECRPTMDPERVCVSVVTAGCLPLLHALHVLPVAACQFLFVIARWTEMVPLLVIR